MHTNSKHKTRLGILVSGRGSNMDALIRHSQEGLLQAEVAVVISNRADALALEKAKAQGIPVAHCAKEEDIVACLQQHRVELVCLAGYMRLVKEPLLKAFPNKIFNIHPSLLPQFPGLNAQRQALAAKVKHSGCTVHLVDAGMDTGPILAQAVVPVLEDDTEETLSARILQEEHKLYAQVIQRVICQRFPSL